MARSVVTIATVSSEAGYAARRLRGIAAPPVTITPPPEGVRLDHDVPVVTRDGTTLRVNVFRPEGDGPWPVIMCAHPYGKDRFPKPRVGGYEPDFQYRMLHQPEPVRFSAWTTWEAPDPGFWVPLGYAVVNADLRGFGTSDGVGTLLSEQEAEDYFDLIEWAAAQPWCTGRVGLNGVSYLALSQWRVAALRPPHLDGDLPVGGLHRRLPRLRTSRRDPGGRVPAALGPDPAPDRRPLSRGRPRRAGAAAAARRLVALAHARPRTHRGARARLRELLRPRPALAREPRGLPPHQLTTEVAVHAPGRQVGDVLLPRRARGPAAVLRPLPARRRQRHGHAPAGPARGPRRRRPTRPRVDRDGVPAVRRDVDAAAPARRRLAAPGSRRPGRARSSSTCGGAARASRGSRTPTSRSSVRWRCA